LEIFCFDATLKFKSYYNEYKTFYDNHFSLLLSCIFAPQSAAQQHQFDSLLQLEQQAKTDTMAVRLYVTIGKHYMNSGKSMESAKKYLK
jgi:hypothetical protein